MKTNTTLNANALSYLVDVLNITNMPVIEDENGFQYTYCKDELRSVDRYTTHDVYLIFTNNPKWCAGILPSVIGDNSISYAEYKFKYDRSKSISDYLIKHHKVEYNEDMDCYIYDIIRPYDDQKEGRKERRGGGGFTPLPSLFHTFSLILFT